MSAVTDAIRKCIGMAQKDLQAAANAELSALIARLQPPDKVDADGITYRWLIANPDEFCSAVDDAYGQWGGGPPADFAEILADEIKHQRRKFGASK